MQGTCIIENIALDSTLTFAKDLFLLRHRLNMELDLRSLFGSHGYTAVLYSLSETQQAPSSFPLGLLDEGPIGQLT
jgi:hypothetical protein